MVDLLYIHVCLYLYTNQIHLGANYSTPLREPRRCQYSCSCALDCNRLRHLDLTFASYQEVATASQRQDWHICSIPDWRDVSISIKMLNTADPVAGHISSRAIDIAPLCTLRTMLPVSFQHSQLSLYNAENPRD